MKTAKIDLTNEKTVSVKLFGLKGIMTVYSFLSSDYETSAKKIQDKFILTPEQWGNLLTYHTYSVRH